MVTIKELSQVVGVSPSTVSIVLRGDAQKRKISKETQDKVLRTAERMGYQVNLEARRLRAAQENERDDTVMVGIFWEEHPRETLLLRFLQGFQAYVRDQGLHMMPIIYFYNLGDLKARRRLFAGNRFHAAVVYSARQEDLEFLKNCSFQGPIINVAPRKEDTSEGPNVIHIVDMGNLNCMDRIMTSMREHGQSKLALCQSGDFIDMEKLDTIGKKQGVSIYDTRDYSVGSIEGGYEWAKRNVDLRDRHFDCIYCGSERMAFGVMRALHDMGVKVPEEMRVAASDVYNLNFQEFCTPSLTSITIPMEAAASETCEIIREAMGTPNGEKIVKYVFPGFIPGESC
ncbi:MAG: LacI family DNA-binding transcriptional regulator [Lachnospiraceae bacterium]|nr:LacI family DNA-binding transcriptional regulator [Lachnospiraceae bacterium]